MRSCALISEVGGGVAIAEVMPLGLQYRLCNNGGRCTSPFGRQYRLRSSGGATSSLPQAGSVLLVLSFRLVGGLLMRSALGHYAANPSGS